MNRSFFGRFNYLLFTIGVVLGALKLLGANISWWWPAGFCLGPFALMILILLLVEGGTAVGSAIDIDPDSHKRRD